ncbi:PDZ domain-containing protein [Desulfatibacillum aliphaticivorans]|uniref:PDZ/DHR/GLGF domain protein n=1 Tax=Desulfatibacillum aliphaticivorans TaxID=218208 RepID=B8FBF6_DESAL|nr:PDZ domain-containing protein [Desulfatibacillum aliphaticivorans]ACL04600.1 PDZ/DHR/GLGF domain protein [Desulfatibacillum aliphaticivorans]
MRTKAFYIPFFTVLAIIVLLGLPAVTGCSQDQKFGGMGLNVGQLFDPNVFNHRGPLVVLDVLEGMPAKRVGVEKGDVITHINNEATEGIEFDKLIQEKMRGPVGESVTLTVKRASMEEKLIFTMTRVAVSGN